MKAGFWRDIDFIIRQHQTGTRKSFFLTMITTYGVTNGERCPGLLQKEITMDMLFEY